MNAPPPVIEANVVAGAAAHVPRSVTANSWAPAAIGDILKRERPASTLSSLPEPILLEFWDFGEAGGVLKEFRAAAAASRTLASAKLRSSADINASIAEKKLEGSSGCSVGSDRDAAKDLAATSSRGGGG